jgi:hypothetical protein
MTNMKRLVTLAGLVGAALVTACNYDKNAVQEITGPLPASAVKFFNFGVGTPSVNFYANDAKMTAITSATGTESTTGVAPGGVGNGGLYSGLAGGTYTLTGKISATTDKDLAISNLSAQIADGKYYSYFISGIYNATAKTAEAFIVEDPLPAVDPAMAYVRFVNAISNGPAMTLSVKNSSTGTTTAIGGDVAYKSGGAFIAIPGGIYDLTTRVAGASTDAITRTAVSFSAGRVYTIGARGDYTLPSTGTSANRPQLDNTANR